MGLSLSYLSPSSIGLFEQDVETFYIRYASERKREPQTNAMAVGSAFDALVKGALGGLGVDETLALYKGQVEEQWHREAAVWGRECYELYGDCGAYDDLVSDMCLYSGVGDIADPALDVSIETDVTKVVHDKNITGVPLRGKPDFIFSGPLGHGILDWKVNGYFSAASPKPGYLRIRGGKHRGECHKKVLPKKLRPGVTIGGQLEDVDTSWARQLAIYGWLAGFSVGDDFLVAIDQLVWRKGAGRVAEFRGIIGAEWQKKLYTRITEIWEIVNSGHVFRDMSREESQAREATLSMSVGDELDWLCVKPKPWYG